MSDAMFSARITNSGSSGTGTLAFCRVTSISVPATYEFSKEVCVRRKMEIMKPDYSHVVTSPTMPAGFNVEINGWATFQEYMQMRAAMFGDFAVVVDSGSQSVTFANSQLEDADFEMTIQNANRGRQDSQRSPLWQYSFEIFSRYTGV